MLNRITYRAAHRTIGRFARLINLRKPVIFCFHSVVDGQFEIHNDSRIAVSASYIEKLVLYLKRIGTPIITIGEAVDRISHNDISPFVVLTFDDGYRDNFDVLYPLMKRLHTPFTIFLTTGLVDRTFPMWWAAVESISRRAPIGGDGASRSRTREPTQEAMTERFRALDAAQQRQLLAKISAAYGIAESDAYERSLRWPMIREMCKSNLLTVGSHTVNHPMLSGLPPDRIRDEIITSRDVIEKELNIQVDYLAYPFGQPGEVGSAAVEIVRNLGFKAAFSTISRPLLIGDLNEMFFLPRILLSSYAQDPNIASSYMSGIPSYINSKMRRRYSPII